MPLKRDLATLATHFIVSCAVILADLVTQALVRDGIDWKLIPPAAGAVLETLTSWFLVFVIAVFCVVAAALLVRSGARDIVRDFGARRASVESGESEEK